MAMEDVKTEITNHGSTRLSPFGWGLHQGACPANAEGLQPALQISDFPSILSAKWGPTFSFLGNDLSPNFCWP